VEFNDRAGGRLTAVPSRTDSAAQTRQDALPTDIPADAALAIAEIGRIVLAESSVEEVLERVATLARSTIPGASEASVTLVVDDRPLTAAFTDRLALELDETQYENGFGPCLDAARGGEVLIVDDMNTETRWPRYAPTALGRGIRSSLSVPLPVQEHLVGALNIYGVEAAAFGPAPTRLGILFASYAAVAVANAQVYAAAAELADDMRTAMASRAVIEQAKGILMAERGCTAEEAFGHLTVLSQNANRKLRDVAADLVNRVQNSPARNSRARR
jgi:GAF domain-containing protein